jgi:hypothetical protein
MLQGPRSPLAGLAVAAQVAASVLNRVGRPDQALPVGRRLQRHSVIFHQMLCDEPYVSHDNSVRP